MTTFIPDMLFLAPRDLYADVCRMANLLYRANLTETEIGWGREATQLSTGMACSSSDPLFPGLVFNISGWVMSPVTHFYGPCAKAMIALSAWGSGGTGTDLVAEVVLRRAFRVTVVLVENASHVQTALRSLKDRFGLRFTHITTYIRTEYIDYEANRKTIKTFSNEVELFGKTKTITPQGEGNNEWLAKLVKQFSEYSRELRGRGFILSFVNISNHTKGSMRINHHPTIDYTRVNPKDAVAIHLAIWEIYPLFPLFYALSCACV